MIWTDTGSDSIHPSLPSNLRTEDSERDNYTPVKEDWETSARGK